MEPEEQVPTYVHTGLWFFSQLQVPMKKQNDVLQNDRYRAWIDQDNVGRIKILRRINFVALITVIRQIAEIQQNNTGSSRVIRIYIPGSLRAICSDNLRSVIEFTKVCCDIRITVIESDDEGQHLI